MIADYVKGELQSTILDCPFAGSGETCAVVRHDRRVRKTGPTHPLVVLRCVVHGESFTVYPPGFVPYARRQLVDGPVQHEVPALMEAVEHIADGGRLWGREPLGDRLGSWSTLSRLLDRVETLFGVDDVELHVVVGTAFEIPLITFHTAATVHGCRARAAALRLLRAGLTLYDLLALGALTGCWGRPYRWDALRDQLVALPLSRGPPMSSDR